MLITIKSSENKVAPFNLPMDGTNTVLDLRNAIDAKLDETPLWGRYVIHANGGGSARIYVEGSRIEALSYVDKEKTLAELGIGEQGCTFVMEGLTLYRSPWGDE